MLEIRPARPADADAMAEVQNAIHRAGLRANPVDVALVRERYLEPEHSVACTVAEYAGDVVGFQSLKRAWPGNPYDVAEGWGIIGTHIHPDVGRRDHRRRQHTRARLLRGHGLHAVPSRWRRHSTPLRRRIGPAGRTGAQSARFDR